MAIGINAMGYAEYFTELLNELGVFVGVGTLLYLKQQSKQRQTRSNERVKPANKRKRNTRTYMKLKELNAKMKKDRDNDNVYGPGAGDQRPKKRAKTGTAAVVADGTSNKQQRVFCKACLGTDHQRSNSRLCPKNKKNMTNVDLLKTIAEEQALLDSIDPSVEADQSIVELAVLQADQEDRQLLADPDASDDEEDNYAFAGADTSNNSTI